MRVKYTMAGWNEERVEARLKRANSIWHNPSRPNWGLEGWFDNVPNLWDSEQESKNEIKFIPALIECAHARELLHPSSLRRLFGAHGRTAEDEEDRDDIAYLRMARKDASFRSLRDVRSEEPTTKGSSRIRSKRQRSTTLRVERLMGSIESEVFSRLRRGVQTVVGGVAAKVSRN